MADKIRIRRGLFADLPELDVGEFGFCTDNQRLYIGTSTGNALISGLIGAVDLTVDGYVNPALDNTYGLGTDDLRWLHLKLGPDSLQIVSKADETGGTAYTWDWSLSAAGELILGQNGERRLTIGEDETTFNKPILMERSAAPSTPSDGYGTLYFGGDDKFHFVDSTGSDTILVNQVLSVNGYTGAIVLDYGDVGAVDDSLRGAVNGVAELDVSGTVPETQLPGIALTKIYEVDTEVAMLGLSAYRGSMALRSDTKQAWFLKGTDPSRIEDWEVMVYPLDGYAIAGVEGSIQINEGGVPGGDEFFALRDGPDSKTLYVESEAGQDGYITVANFNSSGNKDSVVQIASQTGNPYLLWEVSGADLDPANAVKSYAFGIDNSDSDKLKLSYTGSGSHADPDGASVAFQSDGGGNVALPGNVIVGSNVSPSAKLHVVGSNGSTSVTPYANADELVIDNNDNCGINMLSADNGDLYLAMGTTSNTFLTGIKYDSYRKNFDLYFDGSPILRIDKYHNLSFGTLYNAARFHIVGEDGTTSVYPHTNADELLLDNDSDSGLTIISDSSSTGNVCFGDTNDSDIGRIVYDHSVNSMTLYTNATARFFISSDGYAGINETSPDGRLHIVGSDGTVSTSATLSAEADELILDNNSVAGLSIISGINQTGNIFFYDHNSLNGKIIYDHIDDSMEVHLGGTERISITSAGKVGFNSDSPTEYFEVSPGSDVSGVIGNAFVGYPGYAAAVFAHKDMATSYPAVEQNASGGTYIYSASGQDVEILADGNTFTFNSDGITIDNGQIFADALSGASAPAYSFDGSGDTGMYIDSGDVGISVGGANVAHFDSTGRVGIGTTGPSTKLHVESDGAAHSAIFFTDGGTSANHGIKIQAGEDTPTTNNYFIDLYDGNGTQEGGILVPTGGAPAFYVSSDERIKENIIPTKVSGLDTINAINLYEFDRVKNNVNDKIPITPRHSKIGFVAQQVKDVYPDMVGEDSDTGTMHVADGLLIPVLVKAIQELTERIKELENKN